MFPRAVGSPLVMDSNSICKKTKRLAGRQKTICKREPEIVAEVAEGAKLALHECKFQFRERRWNCSTARRSINRILRRSEYISLIQIMVSLLFVITVQLCHVQWQRLFPHRDDRFRSKVGQIGPQIGQIRDFFRSDFSTFGSSDPLWIQTYHPW